MQVGILNANREKLSKYNTSIVEIIEETALSLMVFYFLIILILMLTRCLLLQLVNIK